VYLPVATESLRPLTGCCIRGTLPVSGHCSPSIFQPLSIRADISSHHPSASVRPSRIDAAAVAAGPAPCGGCAGGAAEEAPGVAAAVATAAAGRLVPGDGAVDVGGVGEPFVSPSISSV